MSSEFTSSGISFESLGNSGEFMKMLMENICSCVLILNDKMELQAFNNAMKTIFANKPDEDLYYKRCGEAIGCAHTVKEMKECGKTSKCKYCELRESAMISYLEKKPIYRKKMDREFFINDKKKEMKHLQFSTRPIYFKNEYYILLIIEDISRVVEQNHLIKLQQEQIKKLSMN